MRPEDRSIQPSDPRGQIQAPVRDDSGGQSAAANIARTQIDSIYENPASAGDSSPTSSAIPASYKRTHSNDHVTHAEAWKQYHTAWQEYYQKYYEHYYVGAVKQVHESFAKSKNDGTENNSPDTSGTMTRRAALADLRSQLLARAKKSGQKVRKSRHFVPLAAALIVLLLFSVLQHNRAIIANVKAYVTPGEIDPQNIVVDPNASLQVGPEPLLIIPKINVNVPVDYTATPDQDSQLKAMENGVAWFGIPGANSRPGQIGNTAISGHSSNDFIDSGRYKFVFALLERLEPGDVFYLHYEGIRYTYSITKTNVVKPTDVSSLVYETTKPEVTLITCTPLGTALNRLLVTAEQVSPSPSTATPAPAASTITDDEVMPGNSPTFLERLLGS